MRLDFGPRHAPIGSTSGTIALHGDLRAAAGFARDRHDLDGAVGDLRNLQLEQPLHEPLGRARENDLRSLRRLLARRARTRE